jgi:hypothetical protein
MTKLPMTAARANELPAVCLERGDDIPYFHGV